MRNRISTLVLALLSASTVFAGHAAPPAAAPADAAASGMTNNEKAAYGLGVALWRNVQMFGLTPAEVEIVLRAFTDAAAGAEPMVTLEEARPLLEALHKERLEQQLAAQKAAGQAFADKAAAQAGAVRTASGLIYRETVAGGGATPTRADRVKVHYRGTLVDGTEFDSSHRSGRPAQFALGEVVACWSEALQKMRVGGQATIVCPSEIAYGDRGRPSIPPGATLVFDIELLEIVTKPEAPAADE